MRDPGSDLTRDARLALDSELGAGVVTEQDLAAAVGAVPARRGITPRPVREAQRMAMKLGLRDGVSTMLDHGTAIRVRALAEKSGSAPRFLIRVDEFPNATSYYEPRRYGTDATKTFHEAMMEAEVPYLMAVLPQLTTDYLDPTVDGGRELDDAELALLAQMRSDGVEFGQHGVTHRTRFTSPRRHSELGGFGSDVGPLLDAGRERLRRAGIETRVLVPPFNRFDLTQWETLSSRYAVITGGPESVRLVGARPSPTWWGEAVYLPCYPPLYGTAATIIGAVERILATPTGAWVPVVLHSGWELDDDLRSLRQLLRLLGPGAVPWPAFLAAVDRSARAST